MKIAAIEDLHADAGWFTQSFVKVVTDDGLVGWSEYRADAGNAGITATIRALAAGLIGSDPRAIERIAALLQARTVQAASGINRQAAGAILNALLDIKAKALGVSVAALLGGPVRDRLPLYWSHCGSYRLRHAERLGVPPIRTYDDLERLGAEVRQRGFKALKTSILTFDGRQLGNFGPGFGWSTGFPALNLERSLLRSVDRQLAALRAGAGDDVALMLDANNHFRLEGFVQLARMLERHELLWLELDGLDPAALAYLRGASRCPIASCEALYGRRELLPHLNAGAVDVAIIDANWNGFVEAWKMATLADTFGINVATHGYGGVLGECISAQFAAAIPNLRIMEIDIDHVPWASDFVTRPHQIVAGELVLSDAPGWGADVDEAAVRAHPPRPS